MNKNPFYQTILMAIIFLQMIPSPLISQELQCVSSDILYQIQGSNHWEKDLQKNLDRMWSWHQEKLFQSQNIPSSRAELHTVSVVFHIVTNSGPGISDARILNSLNWLNDAFGNRGYYDPATGADIEVQFCLAKRDENGDPSTGIYRLNSPLSDMTMENEDLDLKNLSRQDPRCYINIWVVDEINSISSGSGVAGYARLPSAHGSAGDGIVMEARFTGVSEAYNSVLVHEMGHYLGLYHTFEGGCRNNDCMVDGDLVCDTPPDQSTGYVSCNGMMNTCNTDTDSGFATDQEDMISNYMDYSQLECYHQFTPLQKERMRFYLEGVRKSLLECKGCNDPCDKNIMAIVTADKYQTIVCDSITISNQSVDADFYEWKLNGQFFSDKKEFKIAFDQPGQYILIVEARDADDKCQAKDTLVFQIDCAFSVALKTQIPVCIDADKPFLIELNNNAGFNTEWYIDNRLESQSPSLNIPYSPGAYKIKVKGDDGKCQDSVTFLLRVGCLEICDNGVDDDGDGLYDCFDPDCCAQCEDFYYDPCLIALADCVEPIPFSIKQKWVSADDNYNPVFSMNCGDMNGDGEVEIVCFDAIQGTTFTGPNGNIKYTIPQPNNNRVNWVNPTTIGQVDGDRIGEYYYVNIDNYLNCYRADGSQRFISTQPVENRGGFLQWDPLHLTDLNLDGIPEVVITYNIYNGLTGERYSTWDPSIKQPTVGGHFAIWDMLPDDACLDCEGLEIINGTQIISVSNDLRTMTVVRNYPTTGEGHGCLADWDLDGDLDVVGLIRTGQSGQIIVWDGQTLDRIASQTFMGSSNPHVVANFDSDPEPEMAFIDPFSRLLTRFDNDLSTTWTREIEEPSFISPICFDFHQDGISEIIVRGAQQLRIINAENGNRIYEYSCQSVTNDERPLLADIDGDGHAEIVVSCAIPNRGIRASLVVFEGDQNEWPKTRPVVHQYGFFNMHINDDLTIPKFAQKHSLLHPIQDVNSYMTQIAIPELDTMELALTIDTSWCDGDSLHIVANICTSSDNYPQPLWVSLYNNSPILVGTKRLASLRVDGGKFLGSSCFLDTLKWKVDADLTNQICIIINDDGSRQLPFDPTDGMGFGGPGECDYINNWDCFELDLPTIQIDPLPDTVICQNIPIEVSVPTGYSNYLWSTNETTEKIRITDPGIYWVKVGDGCSGFASDTFEVKSYQNIPLILPDTIYQCEAGIVVLNIHHSYQFYRWHDSSSDSSFTAFGPGKYWVTVKDQCGLIQTDTTYILLKNLPSLDLPDTVRLCPGDTTYIQASNFTNVIWQPNQNITCQECPRPGFFPTQSGWYFAFGVTDEGCVKEDSVFLDINGQIDIQDTLAICSGLLAYYRNDSFPAGSHQVRVSSPNDCDTVIQLQVNSTPSDTLFETVPVCFSDSLFYKGKFY